MLSNNYTKIISWKCAVNEIEGFKISTNEVVKESFRSHNTSKLDGNQVGQCDIAEEDKVFSTIIKFSSSFVAWYKL